MSLPGFSLVRCRLAAAIGVSVLCWANTSAAAEPASPAAAVWPVLPERDGAVMIPAQEWPEQPGPRQVRVGIYYPDGTRLGIGPRTGIFLCLHNWGGLDTDGTANPQAIAACLNLQTNL